jgi:hypothetical protein
LAKNGIIVFVCLPETHEVIIKEAAKKTSPELRIIEKFNNKTNMSINYQFRRIKNEF